MEIISGSVGLDGINSPSDVRWVQTRLNVHRPSIKDSREIAVDGIAGPATINAIKTFQLEIVKTLSPDGKVDPEGPTLRKLACSLLDSRTLLVNSSSTTPSTQKPSALVSLRFPLANRPALDYHPNLNHHRWFGAWRDNKTRRHAGCDLIAPVGTPILAIDEGKVVGHSPHFYKGTHALEVAHTCGLLARYCELKGLAPDVKIGSTVKRGQVIAYVGKLPSSSSMLHFELYSNTQKGALTVRDTSSPQIYKDKLFQRRADLIDPTSYLDAATLS